jgi:hypothetical protein
MSNASNSTQYILENFGGLVRFADACVTESMTPATQFELVICAVSYVVNIEAETQGISRASRARLAAANTWATAARGAVLRNVAQGSYAGSNDADEQPRMSFYRAKGANFDTVIYQALDIVLLDIRAKVHKLQAYIPSLSTERDLGRCAIETVIRGMGRTVSRSQGE